MLVVDHQDVFTSNLARTLAAQDGLGVIGTARSISEARRCLANAVPDVVLVNYRLPDGDAVRALSELQAVQSRAKYLLMTRRADDELLVRAMDAGVCGFVDKSQSLSVFRAAVLAAHGGDAVIAPRVLARLMPLARQRPGARPIRVTPRDRDLLLLLAQGLTNEEISERTAMDVPTLRLQAATLCAKLGAHSTLEALSIASLQGLLPSKPN